MKKNEIAKIRDMTEKDLNGKLADLKEELFNLRFQMATGQLDNPMRLREIRKDIARTKTVIREKALQEQFGDNWRSTARISLVRQ